jgi:sRNA-binding protein
MCELRRLALTGSTSTATRAALSPKRKRRTRRRTLAGLRAQETAVNKVLRSLRYLFPRTFVMHETKRKPLKLDIDADIETAIGAVKGLHSALHIYPGNVCYLKMHKAGADRIDLNGNVVGTVTAEEAAERLATIMAKRKAALRASRALAIGIVPSG